MFKERETLFSFNNNHFDTFNYGKSNNDFYSQSLLNSNHCDQRKHVPTSLHSSCSGDEETSISPTNSFCAGLSSRSDSDFGFKTGGSCERLSTMSPSGPGVHRGTKCYSCGQPILSRYYVLAMNHHFHTECLKCHICTTVLSEEPTCFEKDNRILCKQDYYRLYHEASAKFAKRCARCTNLINANDLVMKVRDFVYHVDCFVCNICQRSFNRGDHFRMQSTDLYCRLHYDMIENFNSAEETNLLESSNSKSSNSPNNKRGRPPKRKLHSGGVQDNFKESDSVDYFPHSKVSSLSLSNVGSMSTELNQIMDSHSPINGFNMSSLVHNRNSGEIMGGMTPMGADGTPSNQKGKRMRTTFKHNQLRVMKSYFEMNPNPDTKDLKQLSQKTGLCKRVLQVWFQNARAKHRRTCPRPDSSLSGNGGLQLNDDSQECEWSPQPPQSYSNPQSTEINSSLPLPLIQG